MKELSVAVRSAGAVRVITLTGFLDAHNSAELAGALDEALKTKQFRVVLDLSSLQYMGSAGIEAIISRLGRFREGQGDIRLAAPAVKVVKALRLTGLERRYFLALVDHGNAKSSAGREALFEKLVELKEQALPDESDKATLAYFSEWYHPVIRELVGTPGFRNDPVWIAGHIVPRIRPEQVRASLALQEKLGLIAFDAERQTYVQTKARISTGHRVKGMALTRYLLREVRRSAEPRRSARGCRCGSKIKSCLQSQTRFRNTNCPPGLRRTTRRYFSSMFRCHPDPAMYARW